MKKYENPEFNIIKFDVSDVVQTSIAVPENFGFTKEADKMGASVEWVETWQ